MKPRRDSFIFPVVFRDTLFSFNLRLEEDIVQKLRGTQWEFFHKKRNLLTQLSFILVQQYNNYEPQACSLYFFVQHVLEQETRCVRSWGADHLATILLLSYYLSHNEESFNTIISYCGKVISYLFNLIILITFLHVAWARTGNPQ